jgi:hypothetical protein
MAFAAWGPNANLNANALNNWLARMQQVQAALEDFNDFNSGWLASNGAAVLEAAPFSYSTTDAGSLVSAMGDMASLYSVANGNSTIASGGAVTVSAGNGHNFWAFAKLGIGFSPH